MANEKEGQVNIFHFSFLRSRSDLGKENPLFLLKN